MNEMDANILIFVLIAINIMLVVWVKIGLLQIFAGFIAVVMASTITDSSIFPWLNTMLVLVAVYSIYDTYQYTTG